MNQAPGRDPMVIDTDVYGAQVVPDSPLARRYAPIITGRPVFLSFQTVAELRYGALLRGWGSRARAERWFGAKSWGLTPVGSTLGS